MPTYIELNPWHKRQAALLYHFASLDYIKGLLPLIDELIAWTDQALAQRSELDVPAVAQGIWSAQSTTAHFSTHAFPALVEFREGVIRDIANRAFERYDTAGENQCSRMLREYAGYPHDVIWMTPEQQGEFEARAEHVFSYARQITDVMERPETSSDFTFWNRWKSAQHLIPRLPRFRLRVDVEGASGKIPPRTGVYVPQDDPYAALQFGWTGGHGKLGDGYTLNEVGLSALNAIGRKGLWGDKQALFEFALKSQYKDVITSLLGPVTNSDQAPGAVARKSFESRPCKWYFVEMINDEYEEHDGTYAGTGESGNTEQRVPAGKPCPRPGYWFTPARQNSRRYFRQGDPLPAIDSSAYGDTFWQWSPDQSNPTL